jgi:hypothetical protein
MARHGPIQRGLHSASPKLKQWADNCRPLSSTISLLFSPVHYISNCIDSFDLFGNCTVDLLPWATVTDFAQAVEYGDNVVVGNVVVRYDSLNDIHSFYLLD